MATLTPIRFSGGLHPSPYGPPTFTLMDSTTPLRWWLTTDPSRALRNPDWNWGNLGNPGHPLGWQKPQANLGGPLKDSWRPSRCPVDLVSHARYAGYNVTGDEFPVGLSPLRILTLECLSQAPRLGGLHRTSRVPFRASSFTPTVHPVGATAQRLGACLVQAPEVFPHSTSALRGARFPPIPSMSFMARRGEGIGLHQDRALGVTQGVHNGVRTVPAGCEAHGHR
jgi:hypothetical protein